MQVSFKVTKIGHDTTSFAYRGEEERGLCMHDIYRENKKGEPMFRVRRTSKFHHSMIIRWTDTTLFCREGIEKQQLRTLVDPKNG